MEVTRRTLLGITAASVSLAGCVGDDGTNDDGTDGESGDDGGTGGGTDDGTDSGDDEATIAVRTHEEYGDILVGPEGTTLYNFDVDDQGAEESSCYDDCEENWPPLTVDDEPESGPGVDAELSTFEREDGSTQVAADGWPLYYFAGDDEPGDVNGQGANDVWWVLEPDGTPIRTGDGGDGAGDGDDGDGDDDSDGDDDGGGVGY